MRIYVASSWRNKHQPTVVWYLEQEGHEAYDFRRPGPGKAGFSWRDIDPGWPEWTPEQWRAALAHPVAQAGYGNDRSGMDWADACVLVQPCGRSAHLEAGFMAGQGKPVFTLVLDPVEPELMVLLLGPNSAICTSIPELLLKLKPGEAGS